MSDDRGPIHARDPLEQPAGDYVKPLLAEIGLEVVGQGVGNGVP